MFSWLHTEFPELAMFQSLILSHAGIKMCESLVDLRQNSGVYMTRQRIFNAKPPVEAVERLREMYGLDAVS